MNKFSAWHVVRETVANLIKGRSAVGPILFLCALLIVGFVATDSGELGIAKLGLVVQWKASARFRILLFGQYPYHEQWRALSAGMILLVGYSLISNPRFWSSTRLCVVSIASQSISVVLLSGSPVGLTYVGADEWGGLVLTLLIFSVTLSAGLPMAVGLVVVRALAPPLFAVVLKITSDIIRSLPLAVVLLAFVLMVPYLSGPGAMACVYYLRYPGLLYILGST